MKMISLDEALSVLSKTPGVGNRALDKLKSLPTVELIRCKGCRHQTKYFHPDKRRKEGGICIYGCDLTDDYTPLGFDEEYCSNGKEREDG